MHTDVLIVGAGPTGLMLANQLARRGVQPLIIDRHAGPAVQSRALGVQARTLEIYAQLGIVEQALALGKRATGANIWTRGRRAARVRLGDFGRGLSPYPMTPDELNVYLWPDGFHLFFPMRGSDHWRIAGILPPALRGRDDVTLDEVIPSIRAEAGAGLSIHGCNWFSTYRGFSLVVSDGRWSGWFRTRVLPILLARAMRSERFQTLAFRTISQIGIHYRQGVLAETAPGLLAAAPRAGDRFPWLHLKLATDGAAQDFFTQLDDRRFHLVVIGQPAPAVELWVSATGCASTRFPAIPTTRASSGACASPRPPSISCARTGTWRWPETTWTLRR